MGDDQPASILTNAQREFLRGEKDYRPSTERDLMGRMERRIFAGIVDGTLLYWELPIERRRSIFNPVSAEGDVEQPLDGVDEARAFHRGIRGWLAFLYAGVDDADNVFLSNRPKFETEGSGCDNIRQTPNIHFDFETMLEDAVKWVARQRGEQVTSFELDIETEPATPADISGDFDTKDLLARFEDGDPALTMAEIEHLRREEGVTYEEYRERAFDDVRPPEPGFMGVDDDIFDAPDGAGGDDGER